MTKVTMSNPTTFHMVATEEAEELVNLPIFTVNIEDYEYSDSDINIYSTNLTTSL